MRKTIPLYLAMITAGCTHSDELDYLGRKSDAAVSPDSAQEGSLEATGYPTDEPDPTRLAPELTGFPIENPETEQDPLSAHVARLETELARHETELTQANDELNTCLARPDYEGQFRAADKRDIACRAELAAYQRADSPEKRRIKVLEEALNKSLDTIVALPDQAQATNQLRLYVVNHVRSVCKATPAECNDDDKYVFTGVSCRQVFEQLVLDMAGFKIKDTTLKKATDLLAAAYHCDRVDAERFFRDKYNLV